MANAQKDDNHVSTLTAALNTNGTTIVRIKANPSNHALTISDGTTGTDHGPANALHDDNHVAIGMAVSSVDGVTPVAIYATAAGELLIDSS